MPSKMGKPELCDSCLKIRSLQNIGSTDKFVEGTIKDYIEVVLKDWRDSGKEINTQGLQVLHMCVYRDLKKNGECSACINKTERILKESGATQEFLNELVK